MNLFNDDYNNRTRPDLTDPVPQRGIKRWLFIFSNHFFALMNLNLLFLLFCLPLVTIPASFCALTRALTMLYRTGSSSPWTDFREGFCHQFCGRFAAVFLISFFPLSLCLWFFHFGLSSFGVGVGIVLIPVFSVALCYFIAYSADDTDEVSANVKRAFFSVVRHPRQSFKLLLVPVFLYFLSFFYLNYALIFMAFILFSAGQLALCSILEDISSAKPHQ